MSEKTTWTLIGCWFVVGCIIGASSMAIIKKAQEPPYRVQVECQRCGKGWTVRLNDADEAAKIYSDGGFCPNCGCHDARRVPAFGFDLNEAI